MKSSIILISGTDTGIGKTIVSAMLATLMDVNNISVGLIKPVESACKLSLEGELIAEDAEFLLQFSNIKQSIEEIVPYRFQSVAAPSVAAENANCKVDLNYLYEQITKQASNCQVLIVEGAGGLLVPILEQFTYADLAAKLNLSVLLVVGSKLGAINHASLSFEVMKKRELNILGYVINNYFNAKEGEEDNDCALKTNPDVIKKIAEKYGIKELARIPYCGAMLGANKNIFVKNAVRENIKSYNILFNAIRS